MAGILFYLGLLVALSIGVVYFRDLGDIPQLFMKTKRSNVDRFIRNEYKFVGVGLAGAPRQYLDPWRKEFCDVWGFLGPLGPSKTSKRTRPVKASHRRL